MSVPRTTRVFSLLISLAFLAASCAKPSTPTPEPSTPTPTAVPPRALTICLGQEPSSLFPLNNPTAVARSVLAAVYDGPIDSNSYDYQPVILERLPSLSNGDAQLFETSVYVGDEVVDASGTPVTLASGVKIRPAGCRSEECAIEYDGETEVKLDQMQVTFRLLPNLEWSDGEPLTAADSVYAFDLAADPSVAGSSYLAERTQSYEAADDVTIQWWGKPGFVDTTYFLNFQPPLPQHLWQQFSPDQLSATDEAARTPLGWGPYVIREWVPGAYITLTKNLRYFRAAEGLPKFDTLTFRFVSDPETAVSDLIAGSCDVLDPSVDLDGQVSLLRSMAAQNQLQALYEPIPVMEQLAFGIRPAQYDNGVNLDFDRPDYLGDVRVRQALALCIDRQKLVDTVLDGLSTVPASFVPAEYPLYEFGVATYSYDVSAGNALLEQAGWKHIGDDLSQPRQGWGVKNVRDGTPLELTYITTQAAQRVQVAALVVGSLAQCGIKVDVEYLDQTELYAAGPDGPLFGRNFDLAEFAMGATGIEPPCDWFSSPEIPNSDNHWVGTNISGFTNPDFDAACQAVQQSLIDETVHAEAYRQAQSLFAENLPVLPLYWRIKSAAARPDMCNFSLDPTASSNIWNIEVFDYGNDCQ